NDADRVTPLRRGRMYASGPAREVIAPGALRGCFVLKATRSQPSEVFALVGPTHGEHAAGNDADCARRLRRQTAKRERCHRRSVRRAAEANPMHAPARTLHPTPALAGGSES